MGTGPLWPIKALTRCRISSMWMGALWGFIKGTEKTKLCGAVLRGMLDCTLEARDWQEGQLGTCRQARGCRTLLVCGTCEG